MNRKGWEMGIGTIIVFVLGIALLIVITIMMVRNKETANENLDALQQCGGLIGSLGGSQSKEYPGGCFKDKACTEGLGKDGKTVEGSGVKAESGFYFQYIGEGWGCEKGAYCCIQMPQDANPLRASDINRAKCITDLKDGEWAVQRGLECDKVSPSLSITTASNDELTFIYKPKATDDKCQVNLRMGAIPSSFVKPVDSCYYKRNADGVVTFTTSPLGFMQEAASSYGGNQNVRIDLAYLNTPQTFTAELKSGVAPALSSTSFQISTTNPGVYYCSLASGLPCANKPFNGPTASGTCKPQGSTAVCKPQ